MPVQTAIRVYLPNRPDELARMAKWLAQAGVNIETIAGVAGGDEGNLELIVNYPAVAAQALNDANINFQQVEVALAWIPNRPGGLARATGALAGAGININSSYVVRTEGSNILVAFGSDDAERADEVLSALR